MSRLVDGHYIFLADLTNDGQLDQRYLRYVNPPANQFSPGIQGTVSWDSLYFYVCIAGGETSGLWLATPLTSDWNREV